MGLFIGIIRKRYLKMQKSTAEWQLHLITQAKRTATNSVNELMQVGTDYEADSAIAKKLQQRQYKLKLLEEKLDERKEELEILIKGYTEEIESCDTMIEANMKSSFSYHIS